MTLDLTVAPANVESTYRRQVAGYTGPASYASGGDPVVPDEVRMGKVFAILGAVISNGTTFLLGWYDVANGTLMWFDDAGAEASGDLSTYTGTLEFVGQ